MGMDYVKTVEDTLIHVESADAFKVINERRRKLDAVAFLNNVEHMEIMPVISSDAM
ncbi:hypothetical protein L917_14553, partial [Phytophthora nicotianae]